MSRYVIDIEFYVFEIHVTAEDGMYRYAKRVQLFLEYYLFYLRTDIRQQLSVSLGAFKSTAVP